MTLLQNLLDRAAGDRKKLGIKTEMERILELPKEELEERTALPSSPKSGLSVFVSIPMRQPLDPSRVSS